MFLDNSVFVNNIGIVGLGQMGTFFASHLKKIGLPIFAYDPRGKPNLPVMSGVHFSDDIKAVAACDLIFLFPPIAEFQNCCHSIKNHLKEKAIVVECCSVMVKPVELMLSIFPLHIDIIGCHPLFGPQSGASGIKGLPIVLSPVRTSNEQYLIELFEKLELRVLLLSPEEHDKLMAKTQALEAIIGRVLVDMDIKKELITTPGYNKLFELKTLLEFDSPELFRDIIAHNLFAKEISQTIFNHVKMINDELQ